MELHEVELRRIALTLVAPFRTPFGTQTERDILLLRAITSEGEGWGECVALREPSYSAEYVDGAQEVLERCLVPRLFSCGAFDVDAVGSILSPVKGHRMAKSALEMALLDAHLRDSGVSFASCLGGVRDEVEVGVSIGIMASIADLLDTVSGYVDQGYRRIKLKIEPGWDLEPVAAVREAFDAALLLQVDANAAYTLDDSAHLARLDAYDLLLLEQPLAEDDLVGHASLARRIATPICLDESIESANDAEAAIALGACAIVNIKPGRVGGYLEARRIHDVCATHNVAVWCGGMLETGIGRAGNVALASLPNFTLPGDISASARYYHQDITQPFVLDQGRLRVPTGPGLGVVPILDVLDEVTAATRRLSRP